MFLSPKEVKEKLFLENKEFVEESKNTIRSIMNGNDQRKLIILGPCSIHNPHEAIEYAKKVKELQEKVKDKYFLVMRTYFEKPRTTIGWKGLMNDPFLDNTEDVEQGILITRKLLLEILSIGVPTASEFLGTINHIYINDLICYAAIGARTTESQPHREIVSGMSIPVGFKNATNGDIQVAENSILSANLPHTYLGVNEEGRVDIIQTTGNKDLHIILRGGNKPNYDLETIQSINHPVVVDCSHGNSGKDHKKQREVFKIVLSYHMPNVKGLMLESNLEEGNQKSAEGKFGVSITDACISWHETEKLILS